MSVTKKCVWGTDGYSQLLENVKFSHCYQGYWGERNQVNFLYNLKLPEK